MPLSIAVPTTKSFARQEIVLSNETYNFLYTYNSRDERLRLSIFKNGELVVGGLKIMENESLLVNYNYPNLPKGELYCIRFKGDQTTPVTLGTLGFDKEYELIYLPDGEVLV